jgi:hypothetical protein
MTVPPNARRLRPKAPIPGYVYQVLVLIVLLVLFFWLFKTYLSGGRPAQYPATFVASHF